MRFFAPFGLSVGPEWGAAGLNCPPRQWVSRKFSLLLRADNNCRFSLTSENTRLVLTIVLITLLGIALGYVLRRHRWLQRVEMTIMLTIFVMLFVLGLTVGGNEYVVENLPSLGGLAALIALVAMTGSAVLVSLVYHFFFKERGGGRGDE